MGKFYKILASPQGAAPKSLQAALEQSKASGVISVPPEQLLLCVPSGIRVKVVDNG